MNVIIFPQNWLLVSKNNIIKCLETSVHENLTRNTDKKFKMSEK